VVLHSVNQPSFTLGAKLRNNQGFAGETLVWKGAIDWLAKLN
jgi:hypothetical protein